jgi:uracil-DNA glycosylase
VITVVEQKIQLPVIRGNTAGANCGECPFSKNGSPYRPVVSEGPPNPDWIIVGEGPGGNEVHQGRPFVGPSGRLVNEVLDRVKADRETLWITNATCCQPTPDANENQKKKARECCAPRLRTELAQHPGRPVLALGAVAAQGFCGDKFSISQMAGTYWEIDFDGTGKRPVIPTTHPAAILRGGAGNASGGAHVVDLLFWALCYDTAKVARIAKGTEVLFSDDYEIAVDDPVKAEKLVADFLVEARKVRQFACDTETYVDDPKKHSALQTEHAKLKALGLATAKRAISVSWRILTPRAKRLIGALLSDPTVRKVFHNGLYDVPVLERHGFPVVGDWDDTMLLHHNAFPGLAHDLQRVTSQFYAVTPWKAEYRHGAGTDSELLNYNAKDTLGTARIHAPLTITVQKSQAERSYECDKAMAKAAIVMTRVGVPISRDVNDHLRTNFKKNIEKARDELEAMAHDPAMRDGILERIAIEQSRRVRKRDPLDFDARMKLRLDQLDTPKKPFKFKISAGDHIVAFLKARGIPLTLTTNSGKTSTRKDVLESVIHYPEVRALLTYRENDKLCSTYIERMFDREYASGKRLWGFCGPDDRCHPRWSVHKITGRWGSEAPVMQNVPKDDAKKGRPNLRSQVVAPKGRIFVGFDFAQLEAKLIALVTGDPFLLSIFKDKKDIHLEFCKVVWPNFPWAIYSECKKVAKKYDDDIDVAAVAHPELKWEFYREGKVRRDMIKRPEYGAFYAGSVETLWKSVVKDYPSVKMVDIAKMVDVMKSRMPGVLAWHNDCLVRATRDREIRSIVFGRRRCFPTGNADPTDAINFGIQSSGADLMNQGLMRIMPRLPKGAWPILQIHDAAIFECDEDQADVLKATMLDCFTQTVAHNDNELTFTIDARISHNWAGI